MSIPLGRRITKRILGRTPRIYLLRMMPKRSICVEVGTWKGDNAARILKLVRPVRLLLVDPWEFREEDPYREAQYGGKVAGSQHDMDLVFESVVQRFAREIESGIVEVRRCRSTEALDHLDDESLDWVYLDGDHTYEAVLRDLVGFSTKVRAGGYIAGDDYGVTGWWKDGVTKAVNDFVASDSADLLWQRGVQFLLRPRPRNVHQ